MAKDEKLASCMTPTRWAKKLRPEKLQSLYEGDAAGVLEEELLADVGLTLFLRCESIVQISRGDMVCPDCLNILHVQPEPLITTCTCGWTTTAKVYRASYRHRDLNSGQALGIFEKFFANWPNAKCAPERMLLIDQLIHAFHCQDHQQSGMAASRGCDVETPPR